MIGIFSVSLSPDCRNADQCADGSRRQRGCWFYLRDVRHWRRVHDDAAIDLHGRTARDRRRHGLGANRGVIDNGHDRLLAAPSTGSQIRPPLALRRDDRDADRRLGVRRFAAHGTARSCDRDVLCHASVQHRDADVCRKHARADSQAARPSGRR